MKKTIKIIAGLLLVATFAFIAAVYLSTYHPAPVETVAVHNADNAPTLSSGQTVKVLSWNVQFMAGNANNHFFYDDGPTHGPMSRRWRTSRSGLPRS